MTVRWFDQQLHSGLSFASDSVAQLFFRRDIMSKRLQGKVAIVVGAGATAGETMGNGRATAIVFAREGAAVLLVDRNLDSAAETKRLIDDEGGAASVFAGDVTQADAAQQMATECMRRHGRIDVLHNNVGIGALGGPVELTEEEWDRVIDTNLKSMFLTCKHVLPYMEQQRSGAIINISSMGAVRFSDVYPLAAYSASKGGVNALTRAIATQYASKGIRANVIMPGLIRTPMAVDEPVARYGLDKEQYIRMRNETVPMKHMGEAWDVAYAALFLASDEAKYITGVVLPVDGGLSCKG
jgi:NAD(P)-dependent dehydrogenase (short-subunit alcohol dehydrogenase family)